MKMSVTHQIKEEGLFSKNGKLSPKELILLLVIFLSGLFLRIYDLSVESIWVDEGYSIRVATLDVFQIWEVSADDIHPPLYYILLHFWINVWGASEFSTRFLSLIFGFLAIIMIYKVGKLLFSKEVGFISSLLLAVSPFHIRYSQEVRMYSLMTILTLFSFYFFIKLLNERNRIDLIGYLLSSSLLMYTHIFGFFTIIAQNIYVVSIFILSKKAYKLNVKKWTLLQIVLIILYAPYIEEILVKLTRVQRGIWGGSWIPEPNIYSIIQTSFIYTGGEWTSGGIRIMIGLLFLLLALFTMVSIEKVKGSIEWKDFFKSIESYRWNIGLSNVSTIYLLLLWLLTPVLLPFIISKFITPIYNTRFTIGASLAFCLLTAKGISNIKFNSVKRIRNIDFDYKCLKLVIIAIIITISLVNVYSYYINVDKEQWRDAVDYIETNAEAGDLLLFNAGFTQDYVFDYYSKRSDLVKKPFPSNTRYVNEENIKELEPTVQGYDRVWVILSHSRDSLGLIKQTLSQSYNLVDYKVYINYNVYIGIIIYLFEK